MNFKATLNTKSSILLSAEHASARIPRAYGRLGVTRKELRNSEGDVYDIGSLQLIKYLSRKLKCSYLWSNVTRLVVDHNRLLGGNTKLVNTFHSPALKTQMLIYDGDTEKLIDIPGNQVGDLRVEEVTRYKKFVEPFRATGLDMANEIINSHGYVFLIQIHSFHPFYNGQKRYVDVDVIHGRDHKLSMVLAEDILHEIRSLTNLKVELNKPWGASDVGGGVFDELIKIPSARLIAFDVNNKNLRTQAGVDRIGKLLSNVINKTIGKILTS